MGWSAENSGSQVPKGEWKKFETVLVLALIHWYKIASQTLAIH